jgi:dTDP-4-dehydrorhamnose 3,5-epimerase
MHCQTARYSEIKLVTCIKGKILDVAIDLRENSPTFLQWHSEILSEKNQNALMISEGFAHGFQSLSDNVEIIYCHNKGHHPDYELALNPVDPALNLQWPIEISEMSERDKNHQWITESFKGISF